MPVYNDGPYLAEAIESILNQSLSDYEFLIVDDASTDHSLDIIKSYAEKDNRIRYFRLSENQGLTRNLNYLIDEAQGTYIARMDGNDISYPERLDVQLAAMRDTNANICWTNALYIDEQGADICLRYQPNLKKTLRALKKRRNFIVHPAVMYRRDVILSIGKYDESYMTGQDGNLWFRMLGHNYSFHLVERPLVKVRLEKMSVTSIRVGKNQDINYLNANLCMYNHHKIRSITYIRKVRSIKLKSMLLLRFVLSERLIQFVKGLVSVKYDAVHRA